MRSLRFACCAALLLAEGVAAADAHHQLVSHGPISDPKGEVVGFRAHLVLDPQRMTSNHATLGGDVRLALGGMKYDRTKAVAGNYNHHRDAVAGVASGYVLHQLKMREITGPKPTDRGPLVETLPTGGQMKEVEVEVHYRDNPSLVPGTHVDLVAGFWKGSYWHVWGAADSPTTSTRDFVLKLPGTPSKSFLEQQLKSLEGSLPKARADAEAAQKQLDAAQKAQASAQHAYQTMNAQRQAPYQALQQANQAAQAAYAQATQGPQAAYNAAIQAASAAYQQATRGPQAAYQQALATAQTNLRNRVGGPSAYQVYNQAVQAASATLQQATRQAATIQQQAYQAASATLQQATAAARAQQLQANQAAQAAYQAKLAATTANHTTITQQWTAASTALQQATTAKSGADAALKTLTDKIADYKQMLAGTPIAAAQ